MYTTVEKCTGMQTALFLTGSTAVEPKDVRVRKSCNGRKYSMLSASFQNYKSFSVRCVWKLLTQCHLVRLGKAAQVGHLGCEEQRREVKY